jgi:hypothetical protein
MSLTSVVPALVPSDFHNSAPFVLSFAEKNNVVPTAAKLSGLLVVLPA